jgi:MYXO-CTERM domain-containing protein
VQRRAEAGGQGFVTEFAGSSDLLGDRIWSTSEEQQWQSFRSMVFNSFSELLQNAIARYGSFSGFWDVVRNQATLPEGVSFEDFRICPNCYADGLSLSPSQFFGALETDVIAPMRDVQELFDSQPYVTRLYTTLSAAEMTKDPIFAFNADLEDVSNVRTAERVLECGSGLSQFTAPWRIEFADGSVVRGTGVSPTTPWPAPEQPATRRILQIGESGDGRVAEDHSDEILEINDPPPIVTPTAGAGGATGGAPSIVLAGRPSNVTGGVSSAGTAGRAPAAASSGDGGCSIGSKRRAAPPLVAALGLLLLFARRRRQGNPPWRRL